MSRSRRRPAFSLLTALLPVALLSGCAADSSRLSLEEADAERQKIIAAYAYTPPVVHFVQPINKTESCRFAFMPHADGRVYWDGACKNGYAHGIGRVLYRSDDGDMDGITNADFQGQKHNDEVDIFWERNLVSFYTYPNDWRGMIYERRLAWQENNGALSHLTVSDIVFDSLRDTRIEAVDLLLDSVSLLSVTQKGVTYQFEDFSKQPKQDVRHLDGRWSLRSARSPNRIGVGLEIQGADKTAVQYFEPLGGRPVTVPAAYFAPFVQLLQKTDINLVKNKAARAQQRAAAILQQYQEKVCRRKNATVPRGIAVSKEDYFRICTFDKELNQKISAAVQTYRNGYRERLAEAERKLQASRDNERHREEMATLRAQQESARRRAAAAEAQAFAAQQQAFAAQQQADALSRPRTCNYFGNTMTCF